MNNTANEIRAYLENDEEYLAHYGTKRHSGRYPYGSGENPYQHDPNFYGRYNDMKKNGMTEKEIADSLGLSTTELRLIYKAAKNERRAYLVAQAQQLKDEGYSLQRIADRMGFANDSSVRSLLNESSKQRMDKARQTADFLKEQVEKKGYIDVGKDVEIGLGISREKMDEALYLLRMEGYEIYGRSMAQVTNPGKYTTMQVLCPPGTEHKDIYDHEINSLDDYISYDDGQSFKPAFAYPESLDSKRLQIRYAEDGGEDSDGLIELRPGVKDISLGDRQYSQVRIMVDGTHYLKGMAVYSDDLPPGIDIRFNTNKTKDKSLTEVLKPIKDDPTNPFGSLIKEKGGQSYYIGDDGKEHLSLINKRADEGDWDEWGNNLPSQFLSKQRTDLISKQLNLARRDKENELSDILALDNPVVRKHFLNAYAEDCDNAAVHLKAAALPRQRYQVILPLPSISDKEVFAPNFEQGEKVALIRYPHGGTFEIPILTVNNKVPEGISKIGLTAKDAVGINKKVADQLSGADFDGDTVMIIPTRGNGKNLKVDISSREPLKELKGFDPKKSYPEVKGMKYMGKEQTQIEMGKISNLITDMTIKGATDDELARAVKHSMVVIDANKHKLNYKLSEEQNGISELKKKYQSRVDETTGKVKTGAATIISRAKSPTHPLRTRGNPWVNPDTGELEWERINPKTGELESKYTNESYIKTTTNKKGEVKEKTIFRTKKSNQMSDTKDAMTLVSDDTNPVEIFYAQYANKMKALANEARKAAVSTEHIKVDKNAKKLYSAEVADLNSQLKLARSNSPKERMAQTIANANISAKRKADPDLTKREIKKISQQELTRARVKVGAKRNPVVISDNAWKAIQAGAVSENILSQLLVYSDQDKLRDLATPKNKRGLSDAQINKIKAMEASGYSISQIAESMHISTSSVRQQL